MIDNNSNRGYCSCSTNLSLFDLGQKQKLPPDLARRPCYYCGATYRQLVGKKAIELQDRINWYMKLSSGNIPNSMERLERFEQEIRETSEVQS